MVDDLDRVAVALLRRRCGAHPTDPSRAPTLTNAVSTPHLAAFARRVHAAGHSPVRRRDGVLESGGERVSAALERFRQWLVDHYRIIMAAILGLLGLVFLAQGVASLPG